ncbi:RanBP1 domain-containing protein [Sparassis latifolia]|uniref:Ran-specific GTPase-activating protein n=1 Tax=Sparassis crispa TaxID=139825 RepID=A0A401GBL2_9APHY|nr:Ran-specific GTPase-activating protein [Sparassis crispa]GBE79542.1 Ran-specific GTPase-activating protein [Sparassis crispa]
MSETVEALAPREEEHDPQFEPVIKLTEQVETKTHEEDEEVLFKMRAKLFRFATESSEWKERGTGDVRLLSHRETKKVRLVMRRDKTLKVCANHAISYDMRLQPNIGSDRSWVWKVAADYSESPPTSETLAIRFANADNASQFKEQFEKAQRTNAGLTSAEAPAAPVPETPVAPSEEKPAEAPTEKKAEETKEETPAAVTEKVAPAESKEEAKEE